MLVALAGDTHQTKLMLLCYSRKQQSLGIQMVVSSSEVWLKQRAVKSLQLDGRFV